MNNSLTSPESHESKVALPPFCSQLTNVDLSDAKLFFTDP